MPSPDFTINGSSTPPEIAVSYGATVTLALLSISGVNTIAWSIVGTSADTVADPAITPAGSPLGATATFAAASDPGGGVGISYRVQCQINGGRDAAGQVDASLTKTAVVGVQNAAGIVPFASGETAERSSTHGYTMALNTALSNVGEQGPPGTGAPPPNDLVATSAIGTLSGEKTIDGVTTNASRVLLTAEVTLANNGPWNTGTPWTRPTDYTADAQVAAAFGAPVSIRFGTLGAGTTWRLSSGSTIAGAKTYERVQPVQHPDVRLVQTAALPNYTYDPTAKTYTQTNNTAFASSVFDGFVPSVGDGLLLALEGLHNGPVSVVQLGNGSQPNILKRRSDGDSSSDFFGGMRLGVLDGNTLKGTTWVLQNQGTVTLDTTSLVFAQARQTATLEIDLSLPPYNVRDWHSYSEWFFTGGAIDYGPALAQFFEDYRGIRVRGRPPSANGGVVVIQTPVPDYGGVELLGAGSDATQLTFDQAGGAAIFAQYLASNTTDDAYPQVGPSVDSATGATSLSFYRSAIDAAPPTAIGTDRQFFWDLTDAGVTLDSWTQFEVRFRLQWESVNSNVPLGHIVSCRGLRTVADANLDYTSLSFAGACFGIALNESTQHVSANLRVTDTTKGVYAAAVHTGGGAGTVTGDGTVKPTEDAPSFTVRIETGGTAGVAGVKVSYAVDGIRFCAPIALGTATSLTITNEVTQLEQPFSAKVNFSGTLFATDTYLIACSGVNQQISLTSSNTVTTGVNYEGILQYDGTTVRLYVTPDDGTTTYGSGASAAATGVVKQRWWERTILGRGQNANANLSGSADFNGTRAFLGSIWFKSSSVTAPSSSAMPAHTLNFPSGQKFLWVPGWASSGAVHMNRAGTLRSYWEATTEPGRAKAFLIPRSQRTGLQIAYGGLRGLTIANGIDPSQRTLGLLMVGKRGYTLDDVAVTGGAQGMSIIGPDFGSVIRDLRFATHNYGIPVRYFQGSLNLAGKLQFQDCSNSPVYIHASNASVYTEGVLFVNTEIPGGRMALCLDQSLNADVLLQCDAENQGGNPCGRELVRANVQPGYSINLRGNSFLVESYSFCTQTGDTTASNGGGEVVLDRYVVGAITKYPPLSSLSVNATPFVIEEGSVFSGSVLGVPPSVCLSDRANKVRRVGKTVGPTALNGAADGAYSWSKGVALKLTNGASTANRAYTLSVTGMQLGDAYRLTVEAQTHTVTIVNGGAAAGNVCVLAAGFDGTIEVRLDETFNLVRV